jgi:hypothetical protein
MSPPVVDVFYYQKISFELATILTGFIGRFSDCIICDNASTADEPCFKRPDSPASGQGVCRRRVEYADLSSL